MNKLLASFLATLILSGATVYFSMSADRQNVLSEYESWKQQYGFSFSPSEDVYRMFIFAKNLNNIIQHNSDSSRTYEQGVNKFTGFTQQEFASQYLAPKPFNPEWENAD